MIVLASYFWDAKYINTRHIMAKNRRLFLNNRTILSKKNIYFKQAFEDAKSGNQGSIALNMNLIEEQYKIPYYWGGDIKNFKSGIDCSGFIHGLLYYSGEIGYRKRFNTAALYYKLKRDKNYEHLYSAKSPNVFFDVKKLKIGDIILWPSGIKDGRNIPGEIIGHVGIVSYKKNGVIYVTHYVNAPKYNDVDIIGLKGGGINTINATDFIGFKQRGKLNVFRKKDTPKN
jgi:cell wall-associated NlpC family hydrolase